MIDRREFIQKTNLALMASAFSPVFFSALPSLAADTSDLIDFPGYSGKLKYKVLWKPTLLTDEAVCMLFWAAPGVTLKSHKHQAGELTYVIDGAFTQTEPEGGHLCGGNSKSVVKKYQTGDILFMPEGSVHENLVSLGVTILTFNARKNTAV